MEILNKNTPQCAVQAILFDFDGTFSLLRDGWEGVMQPLMMELLGAEREAEIVSYIAESTGIQTIHQMKWLAAQVEAQQGKSLDPWEYKAEYNRRLMETVRTRREKLQTKNTAVEEFLVRGSIPLLHALQEKGIEMFVASGTDEPDVIAEAQALGIAHFFTKIAGAPLGAENCAKEDVIRSILSAGYSGEALAVVGDGKVEIAIGREAGARTLGVAVNDEVRARLIHAGADVIVEDFSDLTGLMRFFHG